MNAWEIKAIPNGQITHFDAAIVLTGMSTFDPQIGRLEFNDRTDRLMQAVWLYREKWVNEIILCGGPATLIRNDEVEALMLKQFLLTIGIPSKDISLEIQSRNTYENAEYVKRILDQKYPNGKFLLVSSGWHLRRATACFLKKGINISPFSTDRYGGPVKADFDYLLIPSSATLFNWEKLLHEWIGVSAYWLMGYV